MPPSIPRALMCNHLNCLLPVQMGYCRMATLNLKARGGWLLLGSKVLHSKAAVSIKSSEKKYKEESLHINGKFQYIFLSLLPIKIL